MRAVNQRTNRVSFPSLERGQQLLREGFRIEAALRLGDKPKLAQIELREVTLPDQAQDVRQKELPVPPGRFMGGQDPLVHPSLDGRDADRPEPGRRLPC